SIPFSYRPPPPPGIYTLSLHDALPIFAYLIYALGTNTFALSLVGGAAALIFAPLLLAASAKDKAPGVWQDYVTLAGIWVAVKFRSEEHTSELQSRFDLVCRLLLEKKKK